MGYVYDDSRGTGRKVYGIAFNDVDGSWIRRREPKAKKSQALGILKAEEKSVLAAKEEGFHSLSAYREHLALKAQEAEQAKKNAITFEEFKVQYVKSLEDKIAERRLKQTTLNRYSDLLRLYIVPFFGKEALTAIDCNRIDAYKRSRIKAGAAGATVCQEISIISGLFTLALKRKNETKVMTHPVWGLVEKPAQAKRTPRYLTADEKDALLSKLSGPLKSAVIISMNTGLRESELASLTWADVDTEQQTITIPGDRRKSGVPLTIPYNESVAEVLEALGKLPGRFQSPYVITNPRGDKFSRYERFNNSAWRKAVKDAGLKLRWHDLRSHWGSKLAHEGAGADKIQALLGQSSLASTQKYVKHSAESLRSVAKGADSRNLKVTTPIATPNAENQAEESKAVVNR